jgi:nucleotidyltransferase substrate binding protein (TIGR01987 family)
MLDLSSIEKATELLRSALQIHDANSLPEDAPEKMLLRDGVIQRFEFTFELGWKMLKRYLEQYGLERVDALNNRDFFRVGHEQGMLADPARWFHYLQMRNQTSHCYDDAKAQEVFLAARDFLSDVVALLERLRERAR